jgi:hypothetical protein
MAWNTDSTANRLIKSYVQDFIDISGSLILRGPSNLYVNGNTTVNGNLSLNNASILTDLSFNKRIFVGGDCSLNGKLRTIGDISINGIVTRCQFNNSSIPQNAFNGIISAPGPDYTKSSVFYEQKLKTDADISFNGNVVEVNRIDINGTVKLSDATLMNKYDDNMSKLADLSSSYISSVCFTIPVNFANTDSGPLDGRFHKIKSSASGKIIAISAGGVNYTVGQYASSSNNPIGNWSNYTKFGLYITRDYGNTWTKYLMPYEDGTKLGYCYYDIAMSRDGKHIVTTVTPNGNNPNGFPCAIAFSHDYGYTWSSTRFPVYSGSPNYLTFPTMCCMSDDGRRMLVANAGEAPTWYASNNYGLSWIEKPSASYSGGFMRLSVPLYCNADLTKFFVAIGTTLHVISLAENFDQVDYSAIGPTGARTSVSGESFPARVSPGSIQNLCISPDSKNILVAYGGGGGTGITNTYLEFYDATTNRWRSVTPTLNSSNGTALNTGTTLIYIGSPLMSGSGKTIYVGASSGLPNSSNVFLLSTDYGVTFTQVPALDASVYAVYDDGSFLSFIRSTSNPIINIFKPNIYRASTFTSLNLTGNLRAGSLTSSSDYRIKTDVSPLDSTFTVDNLRPVKYLQTLINKTRYGVIAHELQLYYPDLVVGEKDGEDLQYVNYTGLIAILINEIKRLKQEVLELENEV